MKRLDRALVNESWIVKFPEASVEVLLRIASDHSPLLIDLCGNQENTRKPWRFEDFWLELPASWGIVDQAWKWSSRGNVFR